VRRIVVAACIAATFQLGAARAQTLYKCASRTGNSYQQSPCAASSRTVESMVTVPEPPPSAAQLAEQARKAEQGRAESAFLSHLAGTDRVSVPYRPARYRGRSSALTRPDAHGDCRLAKATRTATLQAVGLGRTYELLRRLDDDVARACGRL
jgi:hypothetical protein